MKRRQLYRVRRQLRQIVARQERQVVDYARELLTTPGHTAEDVAVFLEDAAEHLHRLGVAA